jgi:5-methylthioribose kinase
MSITKARDMNYLSMVFQYTRSVSAANPFDLRGAALGEVQSSYLMKVFQDAIGFAGVKMIRR